MRQQRGDITELLILRRCLLKKEWAEMLRETYICIYTANTQHAATDGNTPLKNLDVGGVLRTAGCNP